MGASASVLSLPAAAAIPGAAAAIAGAAGCFALGYFLALSRFPRQVVAASPASGETSDEDSEEDSEEEDDDGNSGRSRVAKRAPKRAGLRLLFWARNVVTKSDSAKEAERARAKSQTAASPLEVENLAEIIEDFKMVLEIWLKIPFYFSAGFVSLMCAESEMSDSVGCCCGGGRCWL